MAYVPRESAFTAMNNSAGDSLGRIIMAAPEMKMQQLKLQLAQDEATRRGALYDAQASYQMSRAKGQDLENEGMQLLGPAARDLGLDLQSGDQARIERSLGKFLEAAGRNSKQAVGLIGMALRLGNVDKNDPYALTGATTGKGVTGVLTQADQNKKLARTLGVGQQAVDLGTGQVLGKGLAPQVHAGVNSVTQDNFGNLLYGPSMVPSGGLLRRDENMMLTNPKPITENFGNDLQAAVKFYEKELEAVNGDKSELSPDMRAFSDNLRKLISSRLQSATAPRGSKAPVQALDVDQRRAQLLEWIDMNPDKPDRAEALRQQFLNDYNEPLD